MTRLVTVAASAIGLLCVVSILTMTDNKDLSSMRKELSSLVEGSGSGVHYMLDPFRNFPASPPWACPNITFKLASGGEIWSFICHDDPGFNDVAMKINNYKEWEPMFTSCILAVLQLYPSAMFLDIGSNIGTFSLMAAAMERKVVAVDAVYSNLALISTSTKMTGKGDIKLVYNSVNDRAGIELYPYLSQGYRDAKQAGATYLTSKESLDSGEKDWNLVIAPAVKSITTEMLLADIEEETVILKIDVEGYECKALGKILRDGTKKKIPYIFMEWINIAHTRVNDHVCDELEEFTQSFLDRGYAPHTHAMEPAELEQITHFFDVIWIHKDALRVKSAAK